MINHSQASDIALILVGLHVALNWKWFLSTVKRYLVSPWSRQRLPGGSLAPGLESSLVSVRNRK
jgi:hypothetical protein